MMPYLLAIIGSAVAACLVTGIVYVGYALGGTRLRKEQAIKIFGVVWLIGAVVRIVMTGNPPR